MNQKMHGRLAAFFQAHLSSVTVSVILLGAVSTYGATWIWTGGGAPNGNWNSSLNWGSVGIPANGDTVIFQGAAGLNTTNNIAGLTLNQIKFINGGFNVYGNPFTLTNSLIASNFTGNIAFSNNISIATADVLIFTGNSINLALKGVISGAVGVVKAGQGTLLYQCLGNNTYTGTTLVNAGTLQLNVVGAQAMSGPLVIGDGTGTGTPTVRDLQIQEIADTGHVTINLNGLLDLNGFTETIGSLTMQGGAVSSGAGTLRLNGNLNALSSSAESLVTGNLSFIGGVMAVIFADNDGADDPLDLEANVQDNGTGLLFTNSVPTDSFVILGGSNTISGPIIMNNLIVTPITGYSLGATNSVTVGGNGNLWLYSSVFANKTLSLQAGAILTSQYNNTWSGPIILSGNVSMQGFGGVAMGTLNLAGPISGTGNIAASADSGNWSLLLSGTLPNTFSGDFSMQVGTLELDKSAFDGAIPQNLFLGDATHSATNRYFAVNQINNTSTVTLNGGSLMDLNGEFDGIGSLVIYGGNVVTGVGTLYMFPPGTIITPRLGAAGIAGTISGILYLGTDCTILTTNGLHIPAQIQGNGNLIKSGSDTLNLQGLNTYTGVTIVQQGSLYAENPFALGATNSGTIVSNGASVVLNGSIGITNESLTLNGPGFDGIGGYGSLDVESGTNIWAGPVTNNANSTLDAWVPGAQLRINGPINGPGGFETFNDGPGGGTIFFDGNAANTYTGSTVIDSNSVLVLNKSASDGAVHGNLDIRGTVRYAASTQIADTADIFVESGALLDLAAYSDSINTLHGTGIVNFGFAGWINIGGQNGSSEFDGNFTGTGFPSGYTVGKSGSGKFTMGGNSTYTAGITHVLGGILIVNGSQPTIPVTVDASTTLGGSGTVGNITANGTVAPGNSPGILNSSNLNFFASGRYAVELDGPNPGTGYDQLNVRGTTTLANAALALGLNFTSPVGVNQKFVIINNDGTDPVTGIFAGYPEGSSFQNNGYAVSISYVGGTGNDVVLTLTSIPGAAGASTVTAGDGSHAIDPNGCNNLSLVVSNTTGTPMTGLTATLSTTTPRVVITQPYATYPNISANGTGTNLAPFQISTLPSFVCGTPINLQLSVNSSLGAFTINYVLQTGETAATPSRYDVTGNVAIPDVGAVDSTNFVSGFTSTPLQKVAVSLYITHPFDSDLTNISLISPDGTTVLLSSANGAGGANYGSGLTPDSNRTTFDDAGATSITVGAAPFVGTFRPQSPLSALNYNATPNGNWHLHIADGFGGSSGTLRGWSLFLYGTTCNSGSGPCDYCLTSIAGSISSTDLIQTNRLNRFGVTSSCGTPKAFPGLEQPLPGVGSHYDLYSFTNTSASEACVTVVLAAPIINVQCVVYTNTFNPLNLTSNYAADAGLSTGSSGVPTSCSLSIPPGGIFYVTVNEIDSGISGNYTLQLSGLPCPPPILNIQPVSPSQARIYWDTSAGGYQLQSVSNLTASAWGNVTNEPIVSGGKYSITNSTIVPTTNRFYRLYKP